MDAQEYRSALDKLGMTQLAAGELFIVGSRTSRRWALDDGRIPAAVAMLLRLMVKGKLAEDDILRVSKSERAVQEQADREREQEQAKLEREQAKLDKPKRGRRKK